MKRPLQLIIIAIYLIKLTANCTINPSPASCTTFSSNLTTIVNGVAYCKCNLCPAGQILESTLLSCCISLTNCLTCLGSTTGSCTSCASGYAIVGTGCQTCSSLMSNCTACSASNVCTACGSPGSVALSGGACVSCSTLITNCVSCSASNVCTACGSPGSVALSGGACPPCSTLIANCVTCSSSTACTSCVATGLVALSGGACPPCGTLMSNCQTCSSSSVCTTCVNNGYAISGTLCQTCSSLMSNCVTCSSSTVCTSCINNGYAVSGTLCQTCGSLMPNCQTCSASNACTSCVSTSYAINMTNTCELCSALLPSCTVCTSKTTCTQCINSTYALNASRCALCSDLLMFCVTCSSYTTCTQCLPDGYMLPNQTCLLCTFPINFCQNCYFNTINSSVTCTKCDIYHVVDPSSGYCLSCQSVMTACHACDSNITHCLTCIQDIFFVDVTSIPQHCKPCNTTLVYCLRCLNNSLCIQCISDPTIFLYRTANFTLSLVNGGFYRLNRYTGTSGDCRFCNISYTYCVTCNSNQCLTCISDFTITFVNGLYCDLCSSVLFGCTQCFNQNMCFQCKNSYFTLVTISPTSRVCKLCCDMISGCLLCSSNTVCTACSVGVAVLNGCSPVAGCVQVIQTGPGTNICIRCQQKQFHQIPVNGTCICRQGHVAGRYCTPIIGCLVISRTVLTDTCTSCDTNQKFYLDSGKCPCFDHYQLEGTVCVETCGDGLVFEYQCDDGNNLDLDGCSSNCKIEDKYLCHGGSSTSPSICRLTQRIHVSISKIVKIADMNGIEVVLRVSHPTRHLMRIESSTNLTYSPSDLLELFKVEVDYQYVKLSFKYWQDLPQILAQVTIDLDPVYFIQTQLQEEFLLKTTNGQALFYDKWAGSSYLNINNQAFFLGLGALAVFIVGTTSYKMIGVETLHTFQIILVGMVFSRRYSNFFHNFDSLFVAFGQSSSLIPNSKLQDPYILSFMKYSNLFESNVVVMGTVLLLFFSIFLVSSLGDKCLKKKKTKQNDKINLDKTNVRTNFIEKMKKITQQEILLPLSLGFFYHFLFSAIFQSYKFEGEKTKIELIIITFFKMGLLTAFAWMVFDLAKKVFITFLKFNPNLKYRGVLRFAESLQPHEPAHKYPPTFAILTILMSLYTVASILFDLKYFIEANLLISVARIVVIAVCKPYQIKFHNYALLFNACVIFLAFVWLIIEQFYLFTPTMTKIASVVMFGCLITVLVLALVRVGYNLWLKYRPPQSDQTEKEEPPKLQSTSKKRQQSKSEMEQLLSKEIGKVGKQIDVKKVGWKHKNNLKLQQDDEKKRNLQQYIKKSKQVFALNMKELKNRSNLNLKPINI